MRGKATPDEKRLLLEQMKTGDCHCTLRYLEEAFGTDDFTNALANVAHNAAMKGYKAIDARWRKIVSVKSVADFKAQNVTQVDGIGKLDSKQEHEAYYEAKPTDRKESYTPVRWGKVFGLTMEARANDATGELNRVFTTWGAAAVNTLNYYCFYTKLVANPSMASGNSLFDATNHSNYATSAGISYANLTTGIAAIMNQTDSNGEPVNIYPRYLIVNPSQYNTAYQLVRSSTLMMSGLPSTSSATYAGTANPWSGQLEIIVAPEVTAGSWVLMADPMLYPTLEVGFVGGRTEPETFIQDEGADTTFFRDTRYAKIRMAFAGAPMDYRTVYMGVA